MQLFRSTRFSDHYQEQNLEDWLEKNPVVLTPEGYPHEENPDNFFYDLVEEDGFEDLKERIIIDWGKSTRSWHQWLRKGKDKAVIEVVPHGFTKPWPGYLDFILPHDELLRLVCYPEANIEWVHKLSAMAGIYLITYEDRQYVGSAYGANGIWQRWSEYARSGHGDNEKMMGLLANEPKAYLRFRYSILRTLSKSMSKNEVINVEHQYMERLGSREVGLN